MASGEPPLVEKDELTEKLHAGLRRIGNSALEEIWINVILELINHPEYHQKSVVKTLQTWRLYNVIYF